MQVKSLIFLLFSFAPVATVFLSCNNKAPEAEKFCNDACLSDTVRFTGLHSEEPYLAVIPSNCVADTIEWSHKKLETKRKIHLSTFLGNMVYLNKSTIKGYVIDTSFAILVFNDCDTRRGYWLRLPFAKSGSMEKSISALNDIDPRYAVEEGLLCYKSSNTIYVEDIKTRKTEKIIIEEPKLEFETMYDIIDSVNVTRSRFFIQMKNGSKIIPFEKKINLQP